MTDKQIIETLENIKHYCTISDHGKCRFRYSDGCQLIGIARILGLSTPNTWNINEIERIISESNITN